MSLWCQPRRANRRVSQAKNRVVWALPKFCFVFICSDSGKRNTDEAGVGVGNLGYTDGLSVKTGDNNSPLIKSGILFHQFYYNLLCYTQCTWFFSEQKLSGSRSRRCIRLHWTFIVQYNKAPHIVVHCSVKFYITIHHISGLNYPDHDPDRVFHGTKFCDQDMFKII